MSMPPQILLLDSNAYLRLARSIRPLLKPTFAENPRYSLYVVADLDDEYRKNQRLRNKFEWVNELEYARDRAMKRFEVHRTDADAIRQVCSYLIVHVKEYGLNLSLVDIRALAVGFVKKCPVVSDDKGVNDVGTAFGIEVWSTIKLLKLMVVANRIDLEMVKQVLQYLDHENDLPKPKKQLRGEFRHYFGQDCPI